MPDNNDLNTAKAARSDEFYTTYEDISKELFNYPNAFRGKVVYCNCDDPEKSNFTRYFLNNFDRLGLKRLICTSYNSTSNKSANKKMSLFDKIGLPYDEAHGKVLDIEDISPIADIDNVIKDATHELHGNGDFRSLECLKYLEQCDIVVTNCPFSLFEQFVLTVFKYNKDILVIGNLNGITYKRIFPLIKEGKLWLGASIHSGDRKFYIPDNYPLEANICGIDEDGKRFIRVKGVRWFTNLDYEGRHKPLELTAHFDQDKYPIYDNYAAFNVDHTCDIPMEKDFEMVVSEEKLKRMQEMGFDIEILEEISE